MLKNAYQVLSFEKIRRPEYFGSAALGKNDIYLNLKEYKQRLNANDCLYKLLTSSKPLYFCKVDVQGCFDSIDQELLMSLLEDLIAEVLQIDQAEYVIHKYSSAQSIAGKIRKRFSRKAKSAGIHILIRRVSTD